MYVVFPITYAALRFTSKASEVRIVQPLSPGPTEGMIIKYLLLERNTMKRITITILLCIAAVISLAACGSGKEQNRPQEKAEVLLNDRQREILKGAGLPADFEALTPTQQRAILAIEDMLGYLEEKYDDAFAYAGYIEKNALEAEQLIAYRVGSDREFDCFTVTVTDGRYEDDYIEVAGSPLFSEYICDLVKGLCPDAQLRVYAHITDTGLTEVPEEKAQFDGTTAGSILVFLDGRTCDEAQYADVLAEFVPLMEAHKIRCSAQIIRTKDDVLDHLTRYNYTDHLTEEFYSGRERIHIQG